MITVLVLHPQRLIREVWTSFLTTRPDIKVVAAAQDLQEAVTLARFVKPRIVVISREIITTAGVRELGAIRLVSANTSLILVTAGDPAALRGPLAGAGVHAWLSEHSSLNEMESAIRRIDAGFTLPLESEAASAGYHPSRSAAVSQLTKREFDILELLGKGKTSKEIAVYLNMSHRTVEVHRYHLLKKMDCKKTTELLHKMSAWTAH